MAPNKHALVAVLLAAAAVALMASEASATVTCGQVGSSIAPCITYVTGKGPLSPGCCNGVKRLNSMASTTEDRRSACRCLKSLAGSIKSLNLGVVSGVPGKCGVRVPFPISMSTNCDKIN